MAVSLYTRLFDMDRERVLLTQESNRSGVVVFATRVSSSLTDDGLVMHCFFIGVVGDTILPCLFCS